MSGGASARLEAFGGAVMDMRKDDSLMALKVRPDERGGVGAMGLMQGKRGLVMGVANDHSIAWGIAKVLRAHGAELAFTYQGEALGKRVAPLAQSLGSDLVLPCDVEDIASVDAVFDALDRDWGGLDFVVHAIAFSDKNELKGRYADTTRENFTRTLLISYQKAHSPLRRSVSVEDIGGSALYLLSDLSRGVTGEIHHVDSGYNVISMPRPQVLKAQDEAGVTGK